MHDVQFFLLLLKFLLHFFPFIEKVKTEKYNEDKILFKIFLNQKIALNCFAMYETRRVPPVVQFSRAMGNRVHRQL